MARRRASRVMCGLGNRVNRTPSGLPLCSTCHKELGFCTHSSLFGESSRNASGGSAAVPAAAAAAAEESAAVSDKESVPSALAMNGRRGSREIEALEDFLQPGTKRRRSAAQEGALRKSKRRGILAQPKESNLAATSRGTRASKRSSTRAKRDPRRSTRFADERETPAEKRASLARSHSGSCSGSGDDVPDHERKLLRFRGFEANDASKECMSCYGVARVTVSFMCEERREQAAKEAQAAKDRERRSAEDSQGAGGGSTAPVNDWGTDVPHVMCVDCFRLFVESRVCDRKLVTSHDFDGYTVGCPMGCADSFIDPSCFEEVMGAEFMVKYRRFSAIHLASHMRIVWCPACHCGVVPSAAAAAATRRPSVVPAPEVPALTREGGAASYLRGLWGERVGAGTTAAAAGEATAPRRRPSLCIGCPGCQASLCLSCRALHAPGVDCTAAAAAADAANAADANGGVYAGGTGEDGGGGPSAESGGGGGGGGASMAAASGETQEEGVLQEPEQCTKRCPSCRVPIFKDGGCNHMKCSMCQHEFCWLHLTEWIEGGECQRGHWSSNPALNRAYNAQRLARERQLCAIS